MKITACPHHISLRDVLYHIMETYKKIGPIPTSTVSCSDVVLCVSQTDTFWMDHAIDKYVSYLDATVDTFCIFKYSSSFTTKGDNMYG